MLMTNNSAISPAFSQGGQSPDEPFFDDLQIGSIVGCKLGLVVPGALGIVRPGVVYGLWREGEGGPIRKIEILPFRGMRSRIFPSDLLIQSKIDMAAYGRNIPVVLRTCDINIIDNKSRYWSPNADYVIEKNRWFDILVRRADAILQSRILEVILTSSIDKGLVREGFTFNQIKPKNMRSENWVPDVSGLRGAFQRAANPPVLSQRDVDQIAGFAAFYRRYCLDRGYNNYVYPRSEAWPAMQPAGFGSWA